MPRGIAVALGNLILRIYGNHIGYQNQYNFGDEKKRSTKKDTLRLQYYKRTGNWYNKD